MWYLAILHSIHTSLEIALANYQNALSLFSNQNTLALLNQLNRGIEKEGLRCSPKGIISQKLHPKALGSTLTHPYITTDYSEALLEFITPVHSTAHEALAHLDIAHRFTYQHLGDELIWPNSMPCIVQGEMSVPIAQYGSSNSGQLKHVYRHGLWHRYGRIMQCIAGIHYNFSVPQEMWEVLQKDEDNHQPIQNFISDRYFGLIRNFRRYSWLLLYLFGASPAVCSSFLAGRKHNLATLHKHTLYAPYATSLRMSDLGYQNNAQAELHVCHNSLSSYIETLGKAINEPVALYDHMGVQDENGTYKQLNTNLLQIENEYYSDIRPKRIAKDGEKPLEALDKYGVEYIEVRNTDLNPFMPLGIDVPQMAFMDVFLTWCLLTLSPKASEKEDQKIKNNVHKTVFEGRRPGLMLEQGNDDISLQSWGLNILEEMQELAQLMDKASNSSFHVDALNQQKLKLADSNLTPSAQVLRQLEDTGMEYGLFTLLQAKEHKQQLSEPLSAEVIQKWEALAEQSLQQQGQIEQNDTQTFAEFLAEYLQR